MGVRKKEMAAQLKEDRKHLAFAKLNDLDNQAIDLVCA